MIGIFEKLKNLSSNDDKPHREWLEINSNDRLKRQVLYILGEKTYWKFKGGFCESTSRNFLWFVKFEASFIEAKAQIKRSEIKLVDSI